jgi:hypothetical protein
MGPNRKKNIERDSIVSLIKRGSSCERSRRFSTYVQVMIINVQLVIMELMSVGILLKRGTTMTLQFVLPWKLIVVIKLLEL